MGFLLRMVLFRFLFRGRIGWLLMLVLLALFAGGENFFSSWSHKSESSVIAIPAAMQSCTRDTQCVLVDARCDGCCTYETISTNARDEYEKLHREQCASHRGAVCDCMTEKNPVPRCINRRCAITWQPRK